MWPTCTNVLLLSNIQCHGSMDLFRIGVYQVGMTEKETVWESKHMQKCDKNNDVWIPIWIKLESKGKGLFSIGTKFS